MLTTPPMPGNVTAGAAMEDPASSVAAPPKRSVVPADPVKEPVLEPPPSSPSVPPDTVMSTTLALFIAAKIDVAPVPAVLRTVPLLTNVVVPPELMFMIRSFWMSQVPELAITQVKVDPQVAMSPVPVQVVVPL